MLWINVGSFARRNAEKLRIELVDLIEETASLNKRFSGDGWLAIVESIHVESIGGHFTDGVPAFDEQFPERLGVIHPAGKAAPDTYDSDAIFLHKRSVALKPSNK